MITKKKFRIIMDIEITDQTVEELSYMQYKSNEELVKGELLFTCDNFPSVEVVNIEEIINEQSESNQEISIL